MKFPDRKSLCISQLQGTDARVPRGYHLLSFTLLVKIVEVVRQLRALWNCYSQYRLAVGCLALPSLPVL